MRLLLILLPILSYLSGCDANLAVKTSGSICPETDPNCLDKQGEGALSFVILNKESYSNEQAPEIAWEAKANAKSYILMIAENAECKDPIFSFEDAGQNKELSFLKDGVYYFCVFAVQEDGRKIPAENNGVKVTYDRDKPVITVNNLMTKNLAFQTDATVQDYTPTTYLWEKLSGPGEARFSDTLALNPQVEFSVEGLYEISLTATDAAGNVAKSVVSVNWDLTAPSLAVPSSLVLSAPTQINPTVGSETTTKKWQTVSAPAGGVFTFSDDKIIDPILSANVDGLYVIKLTIKDQAGNTASATINVTWNASLPTVSINNFVVNLANSSAVSVGGNCSENGRTVTLGGSIVGSATCSSGTWAKTLDYSGLADGAITLTADMDDAFGGQAVQAVRNTVKDTVAPTATVSGEPTGTNNMTIMDMTVGGVGVVSYQYDIVDAGTACNAATYSSSIAVGTKITENISGMADGGLRLCVRGQDSAGNLQAAASATTATWTKDASAPTATVAGEPTGTNNTVVMNITVGGAGVLTYQYDIVPSGTACAAAAYSADITVANAITENISGMADGGMRLCVKGKDAAGNLQAVATEATWTKDTTAPTASIAGEPTGVNNTTTLNVTIGGAGVATYRYAVVPAATACNVASYSSDVAAGIKITDDISGMADGAIRLCVLGKDATGNLQAVASATEVSWTKDATAPTATIAGEPTGTNNTVVMDITIAGADVVSYQYDIVASGTACTSATYSSDIAVGTKITEDISGMADGGLRLCVKGKDSVGNLQGAATEATWTKDTTAPTATIAGEPTGVNNTTTLDVTIGGAGVANYQYAVVSSATLCAAATYSSDVVVGTKITGDISGMADGVIRLCVRGKDASGNLQAVASATEVTWTKDTQAPTANLSGAPTGSNNVTIMNITVSGAGVVSYQYDIVPLATACAGASYGSDIAVGTKITEDISGMSDGDVRLCVRGKDSAGNLQAAASATEATWTKDSSAPAATISGEPSSESALTVLDVSIGGVDVLAYQYAIVPSATACSSATYSSDVAIGTKITDNISGMADGGIRLCVLGRDTSSNLQATATEVTWIKDTVAPTATISGEPTGTNNTVVMDITVGGAGVATYQYDIVNSGTACSAATYSADIAVGTKITENISGMADATLRLCVRGKDAAGNLQAAASATSVTWTKDTDAPTATISGEPTGTNNAVVMDITIGGAGILVYQYDIVASGTACASAIYSSDITVATKITENISGIADGGIRLCVKGKDTAGNLQATATEVTWTKDTTAPTATISGQPSGSSNAAVMDITVGGTGVSAYQYDIVDSGTACTAATYSADIPVGTKITENISGMTDGGLRLCVRGKDAAGNLQAAASATSATWTKDTTAPTATISGQPTGTNNTVVMDITVAGADVASYQYDIVDSGTACTAATYSADIAVGTKITENISGMADATLRLCVRGKDTAGNLQAAASATSVTWTKDTAAPTATISGEPTGTNNAVVMNITVGGSGALTYQYDIVASGTACTSATYSADITVATKITEDISGIADGGIRLCVKAKDAAGNLQATATEATWTKDTAAPTATISGQPTGTNNTVVMDITVAGTGVVSYQYDIVASATACSAATYSADIAVGTKITENISGMADGGLRVCVRGKDAAGNLQTAASAATATWTKDTTAPTASMSGHPTGSSNTVVMDITVAGTDVATYQYDIVASGTACTAAVYSADIAVATKITENISAIADGGIRLCVKGKDATGNQQATATEVTWTKDTVAPTATISGQPTGTNNTTVMDITVAGTGVVTYQYDIVPSATACTAATYSADIAVATKITENISGMADGGLRLCVRGKDAAGNLQAAASATEASWTKNTAEINVKQSTTDYASGATYSFGSITVGNKSSDITFTIQNTGTGALSISGVTLGGSHPDEFRIVTKPATSVAGSGSTTFVVRFNPDFSGARSATITIANSDSDESAYTINLSGTATAMTEGRALAYEIDNTANASALTNYPVLVKVDTRTYIANGWMHPTCRDIRFGNQTRTYSFPYWIEEGSCGREDARVWVRVPSIPASQVLKIYLLWGVATTDGSDGERVFSYFDDFADGVVDSSKWTAYGSAVESGGKIKFSTTSPSGLTSTSDVAGNFAIEADIYVNAVGANTSPGFRMGQQLKDYVEWYAEGSMDIRRFASITFSTDNTGTKGMVVGPHRLTFSQTASSVTFDVDGAMVTSSTLNAATDAAAAPLEIGGTYGATGYDIDLNYIAVRKLASPEPTVTSLKRIIPVSASASTTNGGAVPANLYDYVEGTMWAATGSSNQWVEFDLGAPHDIKKIRMRVQQTPSGATTHRIHTGSAPAPSNNIQTFSQSTATFDWLTYTPASTLDNVRYIRIETVSSPSVVAWGEIEIFGEPQQVAFVSTATTAANFGGVSGADAICRSEGLSAGFSGIFKGLVSDTATSARDHVITDGKVYNTAAQLVASSYADMWDGTLSNAVRYQANGVASANEVWTGSTSTGTWGSYECWNWTSADAGYTGVYASPTSATSTWMNLGAVACSGTRSVYCMSSAADVKVGIKSGSSSNGSASALIDGDTGTLWNAGGYSGWVEIDLGRNVTISRLRFLPERSHDAVSDFSIYMGKTPNPTTLVKFFDDYRFHDEVWFDYEFTPTSVRYIRMVMDTPDTWTALREVEIYK